MLKREVFRTETSGTNLFRLGFDRFQASRINPTPNKSSMISGFPATEWLDSCELSQTKRTVRHGKLLTPDGVDESVRIGWPLVVLVGDCIHSVSENGRGH